MYTVLIVEDEILARIGLRQLLNWEKYGYSLLPDATDGREALASIRENKPDIVLLDLNIPKINGLEILKYMREQGIRSRVIVVSCNEEFDMVKDAMKLGAYDYLRKINLSAGELLGILRKCRQDFDDAAGKNNILPSFAIHEIRYEEVISHSGRDVFMNVGTYRTMLCILPKGQENVYAVSDAAKGWLKKQEQEYLQILKGVQCCYFVFDKGFSDGFFQGLLEELKNKFQEKIYMGIHEGVMRDERSINDAIVLAEQISVISYYDGEEEIHYFNQKIALREHSPKEMNRLLDQLKYAVQEFSREDAKNIIHEIFQGIRGEPYIHVNVLRRIFMDMLGIYSMTAQSLGGAIEEIEIQKDNCHYQRLIVMNSMRRIECWFLEMEEAFHRRFFIQYKCSRSDILSRVFDYIEAHLTEQIHLTEAAREIGVSGAYLSTMFKKEIGQNFIEYINQRKIEAAKTMLEEGKLVYEVSDILGFENSTYFSKVFKRYEGISPDAYKRH